MGEATRQPYDDNGVRLPDSWITATLGEIYVVLGGGTPSTEKSEYWGDGTPWITSADINGVRDIQLRKKVTDKGITNSTAINPAIKLLLI